MTSPSPEKPVRAPMSITPESKRFVNRSAGFLHPWLGGALLAVLATIPLALGTALRGPDPAPPAMLQAPGETTVYGPQSFDVPSGEPVIHVEQFPVNLVPGAHYTLRVENGAEDGSSRVTSGTIRVNGTVVLDPNDLNDAVGLVTAPVELQATNEMVLELSGPAGSYVRVTIVQPASPRFSVYGPERFSRGGGGPSTAYDTFAIPPTAGAPHYLVLVNGTSDTIAGIPGDSLVSSARLWLNGTEIVSANEFSESVAWIVREVNLLSVNDIELKLSSKKAAFVTLQFTATDTTPPTVQITSPQPEFATGAQEIEVTGTVQDETAVHVTVNGLTATVVGDQFSATVSLSVEGTNHIRVIATDAASNQSLATTTVIRDTQGPILTVSEPTDGSATALPSVTVAGTVSDETTVSVNVNGIPLPVDAAGVFSGSMPLADGANFLTITATDAVQNSTNDVRIVTLDSIAPVLTVNDPLEGTQTEAETIGVSGTVQDGTAVTVTANGNPLTVVDTAFSGQVTLVAGPNVIQVQATDAAGNISSENRNVTRTAPQIPPDPATVAPAIDPTLITTVHAATEFLYTGANPIQTGVAAGVIDSVRAALIRGRVLDRSGSALSGAKVTVLDHAELGQTLSREDGGYDLVVNGGGRLILDYSKSGYTHAQRAAETSWNGYAVLDDVSLLQRDTLATSIDFSEPIEVARATPQTDADGTRQATLLFKQGTQAEMVLPNGTVQPLAQFTVRATEATVGDSGQQMMPAPLPLTSAYTYAVELSVDEAEAAGATDVRFNQPVPFYLENFAGFPVGTRVPAGRYDYDRGTWVPENNGQIIQIMDVVAGLAEIDTDGDSIPDDSTQLAALGISADERAQLANLYTPGASLWRTQLTHFSWWDLNMPWVGDAWFPNLLPKLLDWLRPDCPSTAGGSIIECENQTLGESIAIVGTPFTLNYRSDRVSGRKGAYRVRIPLTGDSISPVLKRVELRVEVAGRKFGYEFPAQPNQDTVFTWDGKDAYGRELQGAQPIKIRISYVYPMLYGVPSEAAQSFGLTCTGDSPWPGYDLCVLPLTLRMGSGGSILSVRPRQEITRDLDWDGSIGPGQVLSAGLGDWNISVHHGYDPAGRVLNRGDGQTRRAEELDGVIVTIAGTGPTGYSGDGGPATAARLTYPKGLAASEDESIYIAIDYNHRIRRIGPDGTITRVAGSGSPGFSGDGGLATEAQLYYPEDVAVAPDGSLYIADRGNHRIRRVDASGIITTVAGIGAGGYGGYSGDGGPATDAALNWPEGVAVGPDGSVYIADTWNHALRRVSPSGTITTVAGDGSIGFGAVGDGGPAAQARFYAPDDVAVGQDGSVYLTDSNNCRVRRITPDGFINTVAGHKCAGSIGHEGDGNAATDSAVAIPHPHAVAIGPEGELYIAASSTDYGVPGDDRIRHVSADGIISTLAGTGRSFGGDLGPAAAGTLNGPHGVATSPSGNVYIADMNNNRIRMVRRFLPSLSGAAMSIASADGSEIYQFDASGRHLQTLDALTRSLRYSFAYNSAGLLSTITDGDGNVTTIERDALGAPTAIVAPFGQRTLLGVDSAGFLSSVTDPANEVVQMTYHPGGLLATLVDPRGNLHTFNYDDDGRLTRDDDPAGGFTTLARTELENGYDISRTTALGRTTTYRAEELSIGGVRRTTTLPSGLASEATKLADGTGTTTTPDGTIVSFAEGPDPRFGMEAPLPKSVQVATPGGLTAALTMTRRVTLTDPADPGTLQTQTDSLNVNGRLSTVTYDAAGRLFQSTSPAGRRAFERLDSLGRVVWDSTAGILSVGLAYDSYGRLTDITHGTRTWQYDYDTAGRLLSVTDPAARSDSFFYDAADRVVRQVFPDGRQVTFAYDSSGNLTSVTPPSRPAHGFSYTSIELMQTYNPPDLGTGVESTAYGYNLDRQLTSITRPDGQVLSFVYDSATGRLNRLVTPGGDVVPNYDPVTGNLSTLSGPYGETLSFTYDGFLATGVSWSGEVAGSVGARYNNDFQIVKTHVNGADSVLYTYNADGLLVAAGSLSVSRDPANGFVTGTTLGRVSTAPSYNGFGEWTGYVAGLDSTDLFSTSYTRDELGRITQLVETIQGQTTTYDYAYDAAGRLWEVKTDGLVTAVYEYDANGNRLQFTGLGGVVTGSYDAQDRMLSYGNASYVYTTNGELQTKVVGTDTTRYVYDVLGNLTSLTLPDGTLIEYVIDPSSRRVGKKVNGVLKQGFLYGDQLNPVVELDSAGNVVSRFLYVSRAHVPDFLIRGSGTYRIIADHLGSVRLVVNTSSGTVAQRLDYDEFGRVTLDTNPGFQPFGYAGGLYEAQTGLVRFGARDYDALAGRWTGKDPIGFGGGQASLYAYVGGDPINLVDPSGLWVETAWDAYSFSYSFATFVCNPTLGNGLWLAFDALALVIPWLPALGSVHRLFDFSDAARRLAANARKGAAGEAAVRAIHGIGPKRAIEVAGRSRFPDGLTETVLSEVKNVASQGWTRQLQDYAEFAQQTGRQFDLYLAEGAHMTGPLLEAELNGLVNIIPFRMPR